MQSVMCQFRDITAMNIINFVKQLLRATGSGTVCMHHIWFTLCIPSSSEASRRYFSEERTTETVDTGVFCRGIINCSTYICYQSQLLTKNNSASQCHNDRYQHKTFKMGIKYVTVFNLIDATHIPVVPLVFILSFPRSFFFRVVGSGTVRLVMCVTYAIYTLYTPVHNYC